MINKALQSAVLTEFGIQSLEVSESLGGWKRIGKGEYPSYLWIASIPDFLCQIEIDGRVYSEFLGVALVKRNERCYGALFVPTTDQARTQMTGYLPLSPVEVLSEKDHLYGSLSMVDLSYEPKLSYLDGPSCNFSLLVTTQHISAHYQVVMGNYGESDRLDTVYGALLDVVKDLAISYRSNTVNAFLNSRWQGGKPFIDKLY
jgi:hypothetical protein